MMNVDNKDMDLGLALSISNICVQTRWNNYSGAGVNAGSRMEKTFVPSDPLKELVWSTENGPSLKCAAHSFAEKKNSFQWDVGPSNIVCSPSHSIISKGAKDKKSTSEGNIVASQGTHHLKNEVTKSASLGHSSRRSVGSRFGSSHSQKGLNIEEVNSEQHSKGKGDNYKEKESPCSSKNIQLGIMNMTVTTEITTAQDDQRTSNLLPLLTAEPIPDMEETIGGFKEEGVGVHVSETEDIGKDHQKLALDIALASKNHTVENFDIVHSPLLDISSPERRNMELALVIKDETDKLEATAENDICEKNEKKTEKDDVLLIEVSSSDSRMHLYKRKGKEKEKDLWHKELDKRMSKDMDESHGSMESRNSAKLFCKGKRRRSFDHQFIVGSKRINRQIQESPSSNSLVNQDSSFMNWISNMVKGLAKSNEEEGPTNFSSKEREEEFDQKISTFNTTRDGCSRKMGFETVFQSIYLPSRKAKETKTLLNNYPGDRSKELALACRSSGGIMPVSCKQMHVPNYSCKQSSLRNLSGPQIKKERDGASPSNLSQGEKENTGTRGNSTDPSAEGKPINKVENVSTARRSLWITRYSPKVPFNGSNLDQCDKNSLRINCSELTQSSNEIVSVADKGLQNCAPNTESFISFNKNGGNEQKKSVKQKPSESLSGPDEMTSLFARRLDALKHISSVALRDDETHPRKCCIFCGKSGHKMKDCSDIGEMELETLLRNSSLYEAAEETTCLCIKCFQFDHWAVSCPLPGKFQLDDTGSKRCFRLLQVEEKESHIKLDFPCNQWKSQKRSVFSEKRNINLDEIQKLVALNKEENEIQDKQLTPTYNIASQQISEAPCGVFDTVRKLRLSRTNVLKWMNSHFSVFNLDGYFLRLRLAKWKEGPGGAGYYVACINGSPMEKSPKGFKKQIYVTVGGVECLVESQYVSNQDFQEDELMAWWNKATGSGQIPAEADLKVKLEERKKLGF